jgi:deoxyribodipyrimidine photo-lyase
MDRVQVVWFKRDLRVHDHAPLYRASTLGPVLGLFVYEPEWMGSAEFSGQQFEFMQDSVLELRQRLRSMGGELVLRCGEAVEVLQQLHSRTGFERVWSHQETGSAITFARDRRVAAWARGAGVEWVELAQSGVVRRLAHRDGWAARWERAMLRPESPAPQVLRTVWTVDAGTPETAARVGVRADGPRERVVGGESEAKRLLTSFLTERGRDYRRQMSSPVEGWTACSRLSPHLAWGTVSTRQAWQATRRERAALGAREKDDTERAQWRDSLKSFESRLAWRCHFMQKLEDEPGIEFRNINRAFDGLREHEFDAVRFEAWKSGHTGYPMVDACMRALHEHGWLNFRMRAMLVSFAAYHLWLHWREPAVYLSGLFVDFEPGIHFSQFQMQSGVTGINTPRIYSPHKQALDQDPDGAFIRRYVPELADVPTRWLAQPHAMPPLTQIEVGFRAGVHYPEPIVEHVHAYRTARERIWTHLRRDDVRQVAAAVYERHGSRKPPHQRR